ncbi:MAG: acetate kinase [Thalassobaculales bacterium]
MRRILVLNAGSSTLKYALFAGGERVSGATLEGTGEAVLRQVLDRLGGAPPDAVGHRVVHGGKDFAAPLLVDATVRAALEALVPLAPLHQPHNLAGLSAAAALWPGVPQIACFDTAFHRGHDAVAERWAIPVELHVAGLRRYGFHGLSYESVVAALRRDRPDLAEGRLVIAHLGAGCSLCAVAGGRSRDSTMGFTALDGLPMATRCGQIDPGLVLHLWRQGWPADAVEAMLYRQSGLLGLSGLSGDMRVLLASDRPEAAFAIAYFVRAVAKQAAAMAAVIGGLDALVFTGGIGENAAPVREQVAAALGFLGSFPVLTVACDEEGVIARHTAALLDRMG